MFNCKIIYFSIFQVEFPPNIVDDRDNKVIQQVGGYEVYF